MKDILLYTSLSLNNITDNYSISALRELPHFIVPKYSIVWIYHSLFIPFPCPAQISNPLPLRMTLQIMLA